MQDYHLIGKASVISSFKADITKIAAVPPITKWNHGLKHYPLTTHSALFSWHSDCSRQPIVCLLATSISLCPTSKEPRLHRGELSPG